MLASMAAENVEILSRAAIRGVLRLRPSRQLGYDKPTQDREIAGLAGTRAAMLLNWK
jgi:hypothetical protein